MPKSSLADAISQSSGRLQIGRSLDFSGVFETLGATSSDRITHFGASSGADASGSFKTEEISGLSLQSEGQWVTDQSLKLVKLRMTTFGSCPYEYQDPQTGETQIAMAVDNTWSTKGDTETQMGFFSSGCGFPRQITSSTISTLENKFGASAPIKAGVAIMLDMGRAYLKRFFQDPTFSWNDRDIGILQSRGLLQAEIIFPTSSSGGKRIVLPVIDNGGNGGSIAYRLDFTLPTHSLPEMIGICGHYIVVDSADGKGKKKLFQDYKAPFSGKIDEKTSAIAGLTVSSLNKMISNGQMSAYQNTKDVDVYCRLFVRPEDKSKAEQMLGHAIPEAFTQVNGSASFMNATAAIESSTEVSSLSGTGSQIRNQIAERYQNKIPTTFSSSSDNKLLNYDKTHASMKSNVTKFALVTVPWPVDCSNRPENCDGYTGIKEFSNLSKLRSGSYSKEELDSFVQEYNSRGRVKIKVNPDFQDVIQSWFNDVYKVYGNDIMLALPPLCKISCVYRQKSSTAANSRHLWAAAIDFDAEHEKYASKSDASALNDAMSTSILKAEQERLMKPLLEISNHYNVKWGGNFSKIVDYMHFQWF